MSDRRALESPLAAALTEPRDAPPRSDEVGVDLLENAFKGYLNLRGNPHDSAFSTAAEGVLGFGLPARPNTVAGATRPSLTGVTACWLGPDEWMVITPSDLQTELIAELQQATIELHVGVTDLTGGYTAINLHGSRPRDLLAKGCTFDLHPRNFGPGQCAQTNVGKTSVLVIPESNDIDHQCFEVIVRRSFADYLFRWIEHEAAEYGLRIGE
jgi:sarcosine oxidase subunit gamma